MRPQGEVVLLLLSEVGAGEGSFLPARRLERQGRPVVLREGWRGANDNVRRTLLDGRGLYFWQRERQKKITHTTLRWEMTIAVFVSGLPTWYISTWQSFEGCRGGQAGCVLVGSVRRRRRDVLPRRKVRRIHSDFPYYQHGRLQRGQTDSRHWSSNKIPIPFPQYRINTNHMAANPHVIVEQMSPLSQ